MPIWSRNGRELFFLSYVDRRIMVTDYTVKGDSLVAGKPHMWSQKSLMTPRLGTSEPKPITHVTVLLNFFDELRRRAPVSGK